MLKTYRLLIMYALLAIASVGIVYYSSQLADGWEQNFLLSIGTGILCSLLMLLTIDMILKRNAEVERKQRASLAFRRLKSPMSRYIAMFCDLYKASASKERFIKYQTAKEMFCETYFEDVKHLDLKSPSPLFNGPTWEVYFYHSVSKFTQVLDSVIDKYGMVISKEEVKLIEDIINSNFSLNINRGVPVGLSQSSLPHLFLVIESGMEDYIKLLMRLMDIVEQTIEEGETSLNSIAFYDNCSPSVGESRVEFTTEVVGVGLVRYLFKP